MKKMNIFLDFQVLKLKVYGFIRFWMKIKFLGFEMFMERGMTKLDGEISERPKQMEKSMWKPTWIHD